MNEDVPVNDGDPETRRAARPASPRPRRLLRAIRHGEVDALLVIDGAVRRTRLHAAQRRRALPGAGRADAGGRRHRSPGAATSSTPTRASPRSSARRCERVIGASIDDFVDAADQATLRALIARRRRQPPDPPPHPGARSPLDAHISVSSVLDRRHGAPHADRHRHEHADQGAAREPIQGRVPGHAGARTAQSRLARSAAPSRCSGLSHLRTRTPIRPGTIIQRQTRTWRAWWTTCSTSAEW